MNFRFLIHTLSLYKSQKSSESPTFFKVYLTHFKTKLLFSDTRPCFKTSNILYISNCNFETKTFTIFYHRNTCAKFSTLSFSILRKLIFIKFQWRRGKCQQLKAIKRISKFGFPSFDLFTNITFTSTDIICHKTSLTKASFAKIIRVK